MENYNIPEKQLHKNDIKLLQNKNSWLVFEQKNDSYWCRFAHSILKKSYLGFVAWHADWLSNTRREIFWHIKFDTDFDIYRYLLKGYLWEHSRYSWRLARHMPFKKISMRVKFECGIFTAIKFRFPTAKYFSWLKIHVKTFSQFFHLLPKSIRLWKAILISRITTNWLAHQEIIYALNTWSCVRDWIQL